jgi:cytoskeletal protein CcmA (bactofilin family)
MAFFKKEKTQKKEVRNTPEPVQKKAQPKPTVATVISKGIKVSGNFNGNDNIQVDGQLDGNIEGNNSVQINGQHNGDISVSSLVIGRAGSVNGTVRAKTVLIEGSLMGEIECGDLEIARSGTVSDRIHSINLVVHGKALGAIISDQTVAITKGSHVKAKINSKKININGTVEGEVYASELLEVAHDGQVNTEKLQSRKVVVNGKVNGKVIASELLEVGRNGFVQGEITVKNIKTEEGGRVIGTMVIYQEPVKQIATEVIDTETT